MVKNRVEKMGNILYQLIIFTVLSYLITWIYLIPKALSSNDLIHFKMPLFFEVIGAFGPAIAALIVVGFVNKKSGILQLLKSIKIWKVNLKWYLLALFLQPSIWAVAILIYMSFGGTISNLSELPIFAYLRNGSSINTLFIVLILFLSQGVSLLGEEVGWRGFMLPKLLSLRNWLISSLILGVIWALWHTPFFFIKNSHQGSVPPILYFIDLIATTIIFTWIYINSKGSVLIATLFHASINTSSLILPILPAVVGSLIPQVIGLGLNCFLATLVIILNKSSLKSKSCKIDYYV